MATKEALLIAVAGKMAERGIRPEIDNERSFVTGWYDSPANEREDNLHKQSVRALVERIGKDAWKVHINSMGESGFTVEVRPAPGARVEEPGSSVDLTEEGVRATTEIIDEVERLLKQLREAV